MIRKIFKTGHSLAVTLSKTVLDELDLKEGDSVSVELDGRGATIKKAGRKEQLDLGLKIRPRLK